MITKALLDLFFTPILVILEWLPIINIPLDTIGSVAGMVEIIAYASFFLPIGVIQLCIIVWITVNSTQAIKQSIDWILRKIPTLG